MNLPRYKPGLVDYWLGEAITVFVNGCISGLGGGSVVGVGIGATTATTELGASLSPVKQVMISTASLALAAIGNGMKHVIIWHDRNPVPNPWPKPTGNTTTPNAEPNNSP